MLSAGRRRGLNLIPGLISTSKPSPPHSHLLLSPLGVAAPLTTGSLSVPPTSSHKSSSSTRFSPAAAAALLLAGGAAGCAKGNHDNDDKTVEGPRILAPSLQLMREAGPVIDPHDDPACLTAKNTIIMRRNSQRPRPGPQHVLVKKVNMCESSEEVRALEGLHESMAHKDVLVVGGGLWATELALSLAVKGIATGMTVTQVYAEEAPLARFLPSYCAQHINERLSTVGVKAMPRYVITDVEESNKEGGLTVSLGRERKRECMTTDYIVLAPAQPLLKGSIKSLSVNNHRHSGPNAEVAHSHLKDIGLELVSVGEVTTHYKTVGVWYNAPAPKGRRMSRTDVNKMELKKGIVYYVGNDNSIKGVVLWNCPEHTDAARELVKREPVIVAANQLKTEIPLGNPKYIALVQRHERLMRRRTSVAAAESTVVT